ncbi:unnamed protein product, partial [Ectocarpus sp. 12 AP-2014]
AEIVDFTPAWDFEAGGAKLLICLATPTYSLDNGVPFVYFGDRLVQAEFVSKTVVRCRVP